MKLLGSAIGTRGRPTIHSRRAIRKAGVRFFIDTDTTCRISGQAPDWYTQWWARAFRTWEPRTFRILDAFLDRGSSYLDVGAWIGPTVLYAAALARQVYALEPDPEAFRALEANLAANPQYRNVVLVQAALGDASGESLFGGNGPLGNSESTILVREPEYVSGRGAILRQNSAAEDATWRAGETAVVRTVTIDELERFADLSDCTFIKIDIEGGEKIVLPAIKNFLIKQRPSLYLSLHWTYLTESEIGALLDLLGSIYPVMYDDTLLGRVDARRIMSDRLPAVICTTRELGIRTKARAVVAESAAMGRRMVRGVLRRIGVDVGITHASHVRG